MEDYSQVLDALLTTGPLAGVLFFFLIRLWNRLNDKDNEIKELHKELREIERNNVDAFNKLSSSIISLSELIKTVLTNSSNEKH